MQLEKGDSKGGWDGDSGVDCNARDEEELAYRLRLLMHTIVRMLVMLVLVVRDGMKRSSHVVFSYWLIGTLSLGRFRFG